jgi:DNA-binding HxlR family transcriptional regulator
MALPNRGESLSETESTRPPRITFDRLAHIYSAMGNPIRLGILFVLYGSDIVHTLGTHCLRFNQIKKITGITSDSVLAHHLDILIQAGLVEKKPFQDENNGIFPVYQVAEKLEEFNEYSSTKIWKSIIEQSGLNRAIEEVLS